MMDRVQLEMTIQKFKWGKNLKGRGVCPLKMGKRPL